MDINIWFPMADRSRPGHFSESYRQAAENTKLAKKICKECVVRFQCLAYSLYHEQFGIWGGYTERERHKMRKEMNILLVPREPVNTIIGPISSK